jgi:hypothetical protein
MRSPDPAAKSWSDDNFYENLQAKMKSKPQEPLWQPQWKKQEKMIFPGVFDDWDYNPSNPASPCYTPSRDGCGNLW